MASSRGRKYWSHITGRRGLNRVRVFIDRPGDPIEVEWFPGGRRRRRVLRSPSGVPIYDKNLAKQLARELADSLLSKSQEAALEELLGYETHTLEELLTTLHARSEWRPAYAKQQRVRQRFWLQAIGGKTLLTRISPALVEEKVAQAAKRKGWGAATQAGYLRYLVDAFSFAQHKLKWITEKNNLSAVRFPRPDSKGEPYTLEEARKLLPACRKVDPRCWAAAEIAYCTGRRINAIRHLRVENYRREEGLVEFPAQHDKTRKTRFSALSPEAIEAVEHLLTYPAVRATGMLFVSGPLHLESPLHRGRRRKPADHHRLLEWLRKAERLAGVVEIRGRGYHGFKRLVATVVDDLEALSDQTATTPEVLRGRYRKEHVPRKRRAVEELARLRRA